MMANASHREISLNILHMSSEIAQRVGGWEGEGGEGLGDVALYFGADTVVDKGSSTTDAYGIIVGEEVVREGRGVVLDKARCERAA